MKLYYHPLSCFSQKVLMALHEKGLPFERVVVDVSDPAAAADFRRVSSLGKIPFLRIEAEDRGIPESSIIIEYLERHRPGDLQLIPEDPDLSRQVRFRDRFMDQYVAEPMRKIAVDGGRAAERRDPVGVEEARQRLSRSYEILDAYLGECTWAMGEVFSMADCAAAAALSQAALVQPIERYRNLHAYLQRLTARASWQKVLEEAALHYAALAARRAS